MDPQTIPPPVFHKRAGGNNHFNSIMKGNCALFTECLSYWHIYYVRGRYLADMATDPKTIPPAIFHKRAGGNNHFNSIMKGNCALFTECLSYWHIYYVRGRYLADTATDPKTIPPAIFHKRAGGNNHFNSIMKGNCALFTECLSYWHIYYVRGRYLVL